MPEEIEHLFTMDVTNRPWLIEGVEYCDKDHGTEIIPYEWYRRCLNALYWACKATVVMLQCIGQVLWIIMPSGVRIALFKDNIVPDFRVPKKKFWKWSLRIEGVTIMERPIPVLGYRHAWQVFWYPHDIWLGDGSGVYFKDYETGEWVEGKDFTPPRKYGVFSHGVIDAAMFGLAVAIVIALKKTGLAKTALAFMKSLMYGIYSGTRLAVVIEESSDVDQLLERLDIDSTKEEFRDIDTKLGVRLVL